MRRSRRCDADSLFGLVASAILHLPISLSHLRSFYAMGSKN